MLFCFFSAMALALAASQGHVFCEVCWKSYLATRLLRTCTIPSAGAARTMQTKFKTQLMCSTSLERATYSKPVECHTLQHRTNKFSFVSSSPLESGRLHSGTALGSTLCRFSGHGSWAAKPGGPYQRKQLGSVLQRGNGYRKAIR